MEGALLGDAVEGFATVVEDVAVGRRGGLEYQG